jgi:hypothetical protein
MKRIYKVFCLILISLSLVQCQKELSYIGSPEPNVVVPEPTTANLQGNILDENGQPAAGVTVTAGIKTALTDANGYFRISEASLDKKSALVMAEKPGYFKGFRSFCATSGTNQVTIKMVKKDLAGTVNAGSGGEVSLSNGTKISLKSGSVVVASSGAAYTGTVNVFASYIDPTAADIGQRVPGSFMANNAEGSRVILSSAGMVAVELESASGDKLQIKTGSTATLTTAIPASLQAAAPATIDMWHLDEQTGIWQEEGSAIKSGNNYVAEVKHFSFWNCDQQFPAIILSLTVKNADSLPMVHIAVKITRTLTSGGTVSTYGFTDSLGHVSGLVPKNETLQLQILGPCGTVVYSQNVGPFSQNTNLGVIYVPASNPYVITVKGKLLTCAGTPVFNGYALIQFGNMVQYTHTDTAGSYHTSFVLCNNTGIITITGVDITAQQISAHHTITLTAPLTNVPDITACGSIPPPPPPPPPGTNEYINYVIDSATANPSAISISTSNQFDSLMLYTSQVSGTTGFTTYISGIKNIAATPPTQQSISFRFNSPLQAPGTYPMLNLMVNNVAVTTTMTVNVSPFPVVIGQIMEGSFLGTYVTQQPNVQTHTINGSFRLIKKY